MFGGANSAHLRGIGAGTFDYVYAKLDVFEGDAISDWYNAQGEGVENEYAESDTCLNEFVQGAFDVTFLMAQDGDCFESLVGIEVLFDFVL